MYAFLVNDYTIAVQSRHAGGVLSCMRDKMQVEIKNDVVKWQKCCPKAVAGAEKFYTDTRKATLNV